MNGEFDQDSIDEIRTLLKDQFPDVVETYLKHGKLYIEGIISGFEEQDLKKIQDNAHPLKSSSGMLGLRKLRSLADEVEEYAVKGIESFSSDSDFYKLYAELQETAERGFSKLEEELHK